ncbi:MAG: HD domain-containing protein [Lachnospiraceae bacterium]|nr:HD domain-containing protein [Lachnospiraceae bacterium]
MNTFYLCTFIAAIILSVIYTFKWQRRFDINITLCFFLVPFVNLAYYLMYSVNKEDTVIFALKITYLGGVFLTWFIMLCVLNLCKIQVSKTFRLVTFVINVLLYLSVLTIGIYPIFYKGLTIVATDDDRWKIIKEYSFMHPVFYAVIVAEMLLSLTALIYSRIRKKDVSRTVLDLLFVPLLASVVGYLLNHIIFREIDVMPLMYVIAEMVYIIIVRRMVLYELSDMVIETMVQSGETGFINVDFDNRYLGSNETAKSIVPGLTELAVDDRIKEDSIFKDNILKWIDHFEDADRTGRILYERKIAQDDGEKEEEYYNVAVSYLYDGTKKRGYQIFLADDTQNQKYIKLIDHYNSELEEEVAVKTESIINMQNKMVLGMATMVESRDNSTGGHIKRTSDVVRILIDQIKKDESVIITHKFCDDLIKAAPMHDLGKIAVDDDILRKPGRFSPQEYEIMKTHAEKGAGIVHEILEDTTDKEFSQLAENVAHYHHERWDGKGYPRGLAGNEIPYEARIMAVADVYDALVSKRVYKERMSFREADRIIRENMGTQFDPDLYKYYEAARPQLEEYYSKTAN